MRNRKEFKKKNAAHRSNQETDIRIKERKKQPKKINKNNYYLMLIEEEEDMTIDLSYDDPQ